MATATKCNVSFRIDYTSSLPITNGILYYKISGSTGPYTRYDINSVPASNVLINLAGFPDSDKYDFIFELNAGGITTKKEGSFQVGVCKPSFCEIPDIKRIYLDSENQTVMEYSVDTNNLYTPEYQIATDRDFNDIIYVKVGFDYNPIEYINISDGAIPDGTVLYIRARKHCAPSGISDWSNVVDFEWVNPIKAPYTFRASCVSAAFGSPTNIFESKESICWTEKLIKTINLDTDVPKLGSLIYLTDGVTPAIPGNLSDFDSPGEPSTGFNDRGIAWIRFEEFDPGIIYDVDPKTGRIVQRSRYTCDT